MSNRDTKGLTALPGLLDAGNAPAPGCVVRNKHTGAHDRVVALHQRRRCWVELRDSHAPASVYFNPRPNEWRLDLFIEHWEVVTPP